MTTTTKVIIPPKLAEAVDTEQYKSEDCITTIDKFTATNSGGSNVTLTVHLVPSGGASAAANAFAKTIAPGTTWPFPELVGHAMERGDTIRTTASAAGAVAIRASGRQIT